MESSFGNSSDVPKSEDLDSTKPAPKSEDLDSNRLVYNADRGAWEREGL